MILLPDDYRVLCYSCPVDMRKSFDGLLALTSHELKANPLSRTLFVFVGRSQKLVKILFWDRTGFCIFAKRLERGRFSLRGNCVSLQELALFLDGIALGKRQNARDVIHQQV